MVGKLNDMVTAAVVIDSSLKTKPSDAQSSNSTAQIKPLEPKQQSSASMLKPQESQKPQTLAPKSEEEKKEQKGRLQPGTMNEESVSNMTETFNELMSKINVNLEFKYNKEADMFNVKMIDKETKEVIKEFPPEEMLESIIKAREMLGAFIDKAI